MCMYMCNHSLRGEQNQLYACTISFDSHDFYDSPYDFTGDNIQTYGVHIVLMKQSHNCDKYERSCAVEMKTGVTND